MKTFSRVKIVTAGVVFLLYSVSTVLAQDSNSHSYRVHAGLGGSTFGLAAGLGTSFQIDDNLLSARFVYNEEPDLFTPTPRENVWDVGVLYGRTLQLRRFSLSASGGISLVGGTKRGRHLGTKGEFFTTEVYESTSLSTVGFPIAAEVFVAPFSFFGVGIYGFANLNSTKSFAGVLLSIQIGNLRQE